MSTEIGEKNNEKYQKQTSLKIRFFDENPLSIRKIRYNQKEQNKIIFPRSYKITDRSITYCDGICVFSDFIF